jgi:hypothetical protein
MSQLLICCWRLATDEKRIPTSHGLLDQALKEACEKGAFPKWMREKLHFVDARMGLQCVELPVMLNRAQEALLIENPNPSYQHTEVRINRNVALTLLSRNQISEEDALKWGQALLHSLNSAKAEADELAVA